jgi:uncharacterized cupredoxin-like copper-binding protein
MKEPGLAQEMGNANTALQALLNQKDPDRAQVGKQAQILVSALRRAADGVGISLTGTAGAQAGPVGAPAAEPAATPAAKMGAPAAKTATPAAKTATPTATPAAKAVPPAATTAPVAVLKEKSIEVRAREYRFTPPTINVDKGTRVTIKLINEGTDKHEFELDAFRFEIRPIAPRATAQASFVADKAGVFEFACHVDGHYEKGMKGTLVVK